MSILGKVWNTFRNFIGGISGIWCIIIIAALDIQIFCRSFLGFSTTWSEEVAELCFVGLIFCYLAQCEKEGAQDVYKRQPMFPAPYWQAVSR